MAIPFRKIYVSSASGNNRNDGSLSRPYKTIQYAVNTSNAGDTIYLLKGIYKERVQINKSGLKDKPISLKNYPGHTPIIDGTGLKWPGNGHWGGLINLNRQSHWVFEGLQVQNSYAMAFGEDYSQLTSVGSKNILIKNCTVTKAGGSGFYLANGEDIIFDGLIAKETNKNLGQEGLSLANVNRFEIKNCQVINCYKEGIDVKDGCRNGTVHDCFVSNAVRVGFYVDAFSRPSFNIRFYNNIATTPKGAGFSTAAEAGGTLDNITFDNNVVYDSQRGFNVAANNSETQLPYRITNITIRNNVAFNSGFTGVFITANVSNLIIENNILYPSANHKSSGIHVYNLRTTDVSKIIIRNNVFAASTTNPNILKGTNFFIVPNYNLVLEDPMGARNFRTKKNSIADNAGNHGGNIGLE